MIKSHFFKENFKIDENGPITDLKKVFFNPSLFLVEHDVIELQIPEKEN